MAQQRWCWAGTFAHILATDKDDLVAQVTATFEDLREHRAPQTQVTAWEATAEVLRDVASALEGGAAMQWGVIWEFEIPREGGRRPDILILTDAALLVIEVKTHKARAAAEDIDQVRAYARDLSHYHEASHDLTTSAVVLPTAAEDVRRTHDGVEEVSPDHLPERIGHLDGAAPDIEAWLEAPYAPLPSLIEAARRAFACEELPQIKQSRAANLDDCVDRLMAITERARADGERHLVLITGVPGSGKTLVGLRYVHEPMEGSSEEDPDALYLTGNGPLVRVLQAALGSKSMVRPIRVFYEEHLVRDRDPGPEHRLVFDEAQRAWDANRMGDKYGAASDAPAELIRVASKLPEWSVMVALIGQGQEIHLGEEEGIEMWGKAVRDARQPWAVHAAPRLDEALGLDDLRADEVFDLDTSLRGHLASDIDGWADDVVHGRIAAADARVERMRREGFTLRITRDLERAKAYCHERYADSPTKRYGLIASSRAKILPDYGVPNGYIATSRMNVGAWYVDPPDSDKSCCQLERCVTEFGCQGLELDMPLVCWGEDMRWQPEEGEWWTSERGKADDPGRLRRNSYRVLLTRGRDGLVLYVPPEERLDATYDALVRAGCAPVADAEE